MSNSNRDRNGGNDGIVITVKDRVIAALLAVIFGGGTTLGVLRYAPVAEEVVRPFPYTSLDADKDKESAKEERKEILAEVRALREEVFNKFSEAESHSIERDRAQQEQINELKAKQALDDKHRVDSKEGYARIRDCERGLARMDVQLENCKEQMQEIQSNF